MSTDIAFAANPFAGAVTQAPKTSSPAQTDASRAIAEVQAAMMIARTNPRDPIAAVDRILNACTRPTLAEAALYQYSRGGQDITGPSIRLAEAIAQQWGNIKTSVRELDQSNGVSVVQAIAWDLETGYQCDKVFHVPHLRYTRSGTKRLEDPRDIYELVANQAARRLRACILAVVPGDVTEAAVKQCEVTLHTTADVAPENVHRMVKAFADFGVSKEQIETRIQRRLDAIQPAQMVTLKKIYASLRDGMSSPGDWFDAPSSAEDATNSAVDKVKAKARSAKARPQYPSEAMPTVEQIRADLENATSPEALAAAEAKIEGVLDEDDRISLRNLAESQKDVPQ